MAEKDPIVDVLVIGGGINGAGIARDLAGRGVSVLLCEKADLASATSSASTKLVHGGLRYLEHYEFKLVREALIERERLLKSAPHIIWPMEFVLPHNKEQRPFWLIRLGLFLYDRLGGRQILKASKALNFKQHVSGEILKEEFKRGFSYSDCWVEDSRLVVLNAMGAAEKGAGIFTRTECVALEKNTNGEGWLVVLRDRTKSENHTITARMVVNASGPWVTNILHQFHGSIGKHRVRLVKGSHIIVPRLHDEDHAYILQHDDKRIIFIIPYEGNFSLIGTTDLEFSGDPSKVVIDDTEIDYLCHAVNRYLKKTVTPDDVLWSYSGVRPLVDDGEGNASEVTRDYVLELEEFKSAPLLSIYGGKITTYRKLAEQVSDQVVERLGKGGNAWTEDALLPGAEMTAANFETFIKTLRRECGWMPRALVDRYARAYGERARKILKGCRVMDDLGQHFGDDVYEAEIQYLIQNEWAKSANDILWRRSKLGLHISVETEKTLKKYLSKNIGKNTRPDKKEKTA